MVNGAVVSGPVHSCRASPHMRALMLGVVYRWERYRRYTWFPDRGRPLEVAPRLTWPECSSAGPPWHPGQCGAGSPCTLAALIDAAAKKRPFRASRQSCILGDCVPCLSCACMSERMCGTTICYRRVVSFVGCQVCVWTWVLLASGAAHARCVVVPGACEAGINVQAGTRLPA